MDRNNTQEHADTVFIKPDNCRLQVTLERVKLADSVPKQCCSLHLE